MKGFIFEYVYFAACKFIHILFEFIRFYNIQERSYTEIARMSRNLVGEATIQFSPNIFGLFVLLFIHLNLTRNRPNCARCRHEYAYTFMRKNHFLKICPVCPGVSIVRVPFARVRLHKVFLLLVKLYSSYISSFPCSLH